MEQWLPIKGYEGIYEVSSFGRVKSFARAAEPRILRGNKSSHYMTVKLCKDSICTAYIHRLVAEAFIPNPERKPEVNHRDGNKYNNNIDNLEWNTRQENAQHAADNKLWVSPKSMLGKFGKDHNQSKTVFQFNESGACIAVYDSATVAAEKCKFSRTYISQCCTGKRKKYKGFIWSFSA